MKQKVQFVLSLIFGLLFILAGAQKIFHFFPDPKDLPEKAAKLNEAINNIGWLMPLVGIAEMLGGILFIIKKFRPLAAIVLFPILIGILLTVIATQPQGLPMVIVLVAIECWILIENKDKYLALIQ